MKRKILFSVAGAAALVLAYLGIQQWAELRAMKREIRQMFFAAIRPVRVSNCTLERFGPPHDGGYLMCGNLLADVRSAYSYGIAGEDGWGCDVSKKVHVPVHQYDCFDLRRPSCPGGVFDFHEECVGASPQRDGKQMYDSVQNQIARNGDSGTHLVVKMDVEGAELDALYAISDDWLSLIDQLVVEFHSIDKPQDLRLLEKLKRTFHIVYVHSNNYACKWGEPPFSSAANEILFVNKRIAVLDGTGAGAVSVSPLAVSNYPKLPECQPQWP